MNIETKHNIGDEFYIISEVFHRQPCSFCAGKGEITGADGSKIFCPKPECNKGTIEGKSSNWEVKGKIKIEGLQVSCDKYTKGLVNERYADTAGYTLDFTRLFLTRVAECAKRNDSKGA
jgi:hypothetical protein